MTPKQAHVYIDSLPQDADDLVIWRAKIAKKQRCESDGVMSFRVPRSMKVAVYELLDEIGAKIGSQRMEDRWEYVLAVLRGTEDPIP